MPNTCSRWMAMLMLSLAVLLSGCSTTILTAPCDAPKVSNVNLPFVYLIVLPYAYRDQPRSMAPTPDPGTAATQRLNEIAALEAVRMGAEAKDMHVTLLEDSGRGCKIESVYAALGQPRNQADRGVFSTIVFFWGEVFDDAAGLVVQSHLRVQWKDNDRIRVHAYTGEGRDRIRLEFVSEVPYQTLSFAPRLLSTDSGDGGVPDLRSKLVAWAAPSAQKAEDRRSLPRAFAFRQIKKDKTGNWAEIQNLDDKEMAWIPLQEASASSILPEFSFANAVAEFVNHQSVPARDTAERIVHRLDEFRNGYGAGGKNIWNMRPDAAADVLQGALALARLGDIGGPSGAEVKQLLDRAQAVLPDDPVVLTLSAMARVDDCCSTRENAQQVGAMFEAARQLDSGSRLIATNLINWYKLARNLAPEVRPDSEEAIARKLANLEEALR